MNELYICTQFIYIYIYMYIYIYIFFFKVVVMIMCDIFQVIKSTLFRSAEKKNVLLIT